MKPLDNRQNKLHVWKEPVKPNKFFFKDAGLEKSDPSLSPSHSGGIVYGLVKDLYVATKIAQAAKHCHLSAHNFDNAEGLLNHLKQRKPVLILFDWDDCEAEAYKVLKEIGQNADLKGIPNAGYASGSKTMLKEEAQRAGCHRVHPKTEFLHDLELIIARHA